MSRSTFADASNITYAFSPDAKRIAVGTIAGGTTGGWWIQAASGSGTQEKLENPGTWGSVLSWSPSGRYVFFMVQNNATRQDVYYADLDGDKKLVPYLTSPANETGAVLSPNGKWLAYMSRRIRKVRSLRNRIPECWRKMAGLKWWRDWSFVERGWQATLLRERG